MIFKSIKWRLQIWYGLILVAVLAGFGFTAYRLEGGRQMRRIDDELQRRVAVLAMALHTPPHRPDAGEPPFDHPPSGQFPDDGPTGQDFGAPAGFHLPPQAAGLFDANDPNNFYFIVKSSDGNELARSTNAPGIEIREDHNPDKLHVVHRLVTVESNAVELPFQSYFAKNNLPPQLGPNPPHLSPAQMFTFGEFREITQKLPHGEIVLAGCSFAPEVKELRLTALKLLGVGGIILFFGLAGGWWISSRAIRPIDDISAAAVKISAGDLSQRIDVAEAESELGRLASVLNATFARLEAAFAQQQQFTADAAHELRTPVSVMITQTQATLNRERSPTEYRATVEACHRAAQRIRRLIESLLELARLDAGQEPMKRMPFDLAQTVRDCVASVQPLADGRGVKIHCELPPLKCMGDPERLAQVITNLLTNAIQYNREDGGVRFAAQLQNGTVTLAVSDTGRGIPAEDLPHVFKRFYRGDKSRSTGNTGLGLAISKAIVEAHGGTIEVSSNPNTGTTFTVRLPAT